MNSKFLLVAAAILSLTPHIGMGSGNVAQSACAGNFKTCSVGGQTATGGATSIGVGGGLNAVGDKATFAVTGMKAKSFGKITKAKTATMQLPSANSNLNQSAKLYSFTPTVGSRLIANKEQQLLFVGFDLTKPLPDWTPGYVKKEVDTVKKNTPDAKSAVYVYQHIAGEPATQWTELGKAVFTTTNLASEPAIKATLTPNANISINMANAVIEGDLGMAK